MDNFTILITMDLKRKKEGFDGQRAIVLPKKVISRQCLDNPVISDIYLTDIGYYPKAKYHYRKRVQGVDQNILVYCAEGSGWIQINDVRQTIHAGDFFIVPAKTPHAYGAGENNAWTIYWLHMKGKISDAICRSLTASLNSHVGSVNYIDRRIALFEEIYAALARGYSHNNILYANMCLWQYLASFHFENRFGAAEGKKTSDPVSISIDFMQQNLAGSLTLTETANSVNLSVSHFAAIFRKKTGFAPIEYFNHLKIQKACQYLHFTDDRINEISNQLGIEDSYYFSRLFKKVMGVSPLEYRKRIRK